MSRHVSQRPTIVGENKINTHLWEKLFNKEERAKKTYREHKESMPEGSLSCNSCSHPKLPTEFDDGMLKESMVEYSSSHMKAKQLNHKEEEDFYHTIPIVLSNKVLKEFVRQQRASRVKSKPLIKDKQHNFERAVLKLQYLNINEIGNLRVLKNVTKLKLSNNNIVKVEGLEVLLHLQELDLSCNKLTKLENLKKLVHLHALFLTCNLIPRLENLDTLKELAIFGIGRNLLDNLAECVMYLRSLKNLHTLILEGNPCLKDNTSSRSYVCAYLPQLVYYNYILITPDEKNKSINEQCEVPEVFWDSASYHNQAKEVKGLRFKNCKLFTNGPIEDIDAIKLSEKVLKRVCQKDGIVTRLLRGEDAGEAFESWTREMSKDLFGL